MRELREVTDVFEVVTNTVALEGFVQLFQALGPAVVRAVTTRGADMCERVIGEGEFQFALIPLRRP